jgi:hypothetical protein
MGIISRQRQQQQDLLQRAQMGRHMLLQGSSRLRQAQAVRHARL